MNIFKRVAALAFGLLLLWTLITSHARWLFLVLWLVCAGLAWLWIRFLAKREDESFGRWEDYLVLGLVGTTAAAFISYLASGATLGWSLLLSLRAGTQGGGALGSLAFALGRRRLSPSSPDGASQPHA